MNAAVLLLVLYVGLYLGAIISLKQEGIIDFRKPDVNTLCSNIARDFPPFLLYICLLVVGLSLIEFIKLWLPQHLPGKLNSMKNYADQHREVYSLFCSMILGSYALIYFLWKRGIQSGKNAAFLMAFICPPPTNVVGSWIYHGSIVLFAFIAAAIPLISSVRKHPQATHDLAVPTYELASSLMVAYFVSSMSSKMYEVSKDSELARNV